MEIVEEENGKNSVKMDFRLKMVWGRALDVGVSRFSKF